MHRLLGLAPESEAEQEIRVPLRPVNALLDRMLALEAAIVQYIDLPWGSSLLVMARKPKV